MANEIKERVIDGTSCNLPAMAVEAKEKGKEGFIEHFKHIWPALNENAARKRLETLYNELVPATKKK